MILLIDWGNTYLKWMLVEDFSPEVIRTVMVNQCESPNELDYELKRVLERNKQKDIHVSHSYISSVRNSEDNDSLIRILKKYTTNIQFATTDDKNNVVQCAYKYPSQLGVDRWLGVLAVAENNKNILVVSIGSAITLDLIEDNIHKGGQIVPGQRLLFESLKQTGQIKAEPIEEMTEYMALGQSTSSCVKQGIYSLMASYVQGFLTYFEQEKSVDRVVFTGGGGQFWLEKSMFTQAKAEFRKNLVFEGLVKLFN